MKANRRNIRQVLGYGPEDGVFTLDAGRRPANVAFAFKLDANTWIDFPDEALPAVLERWAELLSGTASEVGSNSPRHQWPVR